ncbi:MAG TPA: polysaccharide biosynthesis C-terminal domain-containing protein, partial [Thermoplasmata archaeon]|nr:polysaccharide biosynthesis C-terminal domain-containing protein [Thermoplasmata archaeon]
WGEFSLGIALTGFLSVVALLGIDQATARMLAFEHGAAARRAILVKGVVLTLASGTLASLSVYLLADPIAGLFHVPSFAWVVQLLSVTLGFQVVAAMLAALFQGLEDAAPNALFNQILNPGLLVLFVVLAVVFHLGFSAVILGYVLSSGVALSAFVLYALRKLPARVPSVGTRLPSTPQLWHFAAALWGVGTLYYVTAFVDTLILGIYRPVVIVGVYAASINLARVLLIGNNALTFIYLPVSARLARNRELATVRSTYLAGTRWINLLTAPGMLVFCFFPAASLTAVFGPGFASGSLTLVILAAAAFLSIVIGPANASLAGLGETRWLLFSTVVSAGLNVGLSFALIPSYGIVGAAVAWSVARVAYPTVAAVRLQRGYGISALHGALVKPLLFTFAVGVPLFTLVALRGAPWWIVFPMYGVGALLYGIGLVVTRSLVAGDLVAARAVETTIGRRLPRLIRFLERRVAVSTPG